MATTGGLTEEQKRRMEENRKKALLRRAQHNQGNNPVTRPTETTSGANSRQTATASVTVKSGSQSPVSVPPNPRTNFAQSKQSTNSTLHVKTVSATSSSSIDWSKKRQPSIITEPSGLHVTDNGGNSSASENQIKATGSKIHNQLPGTGSIQFCNKQATQTTKTSLNSASAAKHKLPISATSSANPSTEGSVHGGFNLPTSNPSTGINKPKTITSFYLAKPKLTSSGIRASCPGQSGSAVQGFAPNLHSNPQKTGSGFQARSDHQAPSVKRPDFSHKGAGSMPNFGSGQGGNLQGTCALISRSRFVVNVGYHAKLIEIFQEIPSKSYDAAEKKWSFALSDYDTLMEAIKTLRPAVEIEPLPKAVCTVFRRQRHGRDGNRVIPDANLKSVDEKLVNTLMNFQREGVNFVVSREGRALIADDMGLGKTLQAICIACYYRTEWPVLVVSPSSVRYTWAEAFEKWIPSLDPDDINVLLNSKGSATSGQVNILSYDLMHRKAQELKQFHFQVVIMDECHFLKNVKTARTKAALPLLKAALRVILLSGTPALSRPSELYTQVLGVAPRLFPSFHEFGIRYCNATQNPWGWDYSGSSNMAELQLLLEECIMIRRLKQDVLKELPPKTRQMVIMDPSVVKTNSKALKSAANKMGKTKSEDRSILLKYFAETGLVKAPAIRDYVLDLLEAGHKFLVFAHHQNVLDSLCDTMSTKKYEYIRIDGSTTALQRKAYCDKFQQDEMCRAAVLSITAANAGLTLTSASMVVFAELFWNPGTLVQAEDRVHRIGQQDSTNIRYLIAKGTADDYIWPLVQKKLLVLGKAGLSKDDFSEADTTAFKDPRQKSILSYFEKSFLEDDEESEQEDLACLVAMESQEDSENERSSAMNPGTETDSRTDVKSSNANNLSEVDSAKDNALTDTHRKAGSSRDKEETVVTARSKNRHHGSVEGSQNTQSAPSVIPTKKSKKPLTESNGGGVEDRIDGPPLKRQRNTNS